MIRERLGPTLVKPHPERDGDFRWRGDGVSRIEGLSDAVFGFAITLLVVSLGAPRTYDELVRMMAGFPAFVATFALLVVVWMAQYRFFRRYGLEDATTVRLNVALLCFVVFFVYPLKFLFGTFIGMWLGPVGYLTHTPALVAQMREAQGALRADQWPAVMAVFAAGYVAVFGVFALLHRHALAQADALELDDVERLDTRFAVTEHLVNVGVALASVAITFGIAYAPATRDAFPRVIGGAAGFGSMVGGMAYALTGPVMAIVARPYRRGRKALLAARPSPVLPVPALPSPPAPSVPAERFVPAEPSVPAVPGNGSTAPA